jgi:hypothetical protein
LTCADPNEIIGCSGSYTSKTEGALSKSAGQSANDNEDRPQRYGIGKCRLSITFGISFKPEGESATNSVNLLPCKTFVLEHCIRVVSIII